MNNKTGTIFVIGAGIFIVGWFLFSRFSSPNAADIITRNGLHWHANLSVNISGEPVIIPGGVGLERLPHNPMHTHDSDNVIHMEYDGLVKASDLRLGNFFEIWGKQFNENCIFDKCSGSEGVMKMMVNGKENFEFGNHMMRDSDKIEIVFK